MPIYDLRKIPGVGLGLYKLLLDLDRNYIKRPTESGTVIVIDRPGLRVKVKWDIGMYFVEYNYYRHQGLYNLKSVLSNSSIKNHPMINQLVFDEIMLLQAKYVKSLSK